mgnify:CR=1 FL=1
MATITREALSKRLFSDPKHYPYGFSRSGDFSIAESKALQQYGALIAALVDGLLLPETEQDKSYIASALGQQAPSCIEEKAWLRYQQRINRPKYASIHGTKRSSTNDREEQELVNDIDDDLGIDMDD